MKTSIVVSALALVAAAGALALSVWTSRRSHEGQTTCIVAVDQYNVTEAQVAVTEIAWAIAMCAERESKVPPATQQVPPSVNAVAGTIYQSRVEDWNDEAFRCADFHMVRPQRFQYQWVPSGNEGAVVAVADFDGDRKIDREVRLQVRCKDTEKGLHCRPDRMPTEPGALDHVSCKQ